MNIILYLLQIIQYLYQQNCRLLSFICKFIPHRQWATTAHIPQNTRNTRSMNHLRSYTMRSGTTVTSSLTSNGTTANRSNPSAAVPTAISMTASPAAPFADETYIRIRGIKGSVRFIMGALSRYFIGYQISDNRGVGPYILAMRMAFRHLKQLPKKFRFDITQVIGLTNEEAVSEEFWPFKQIIERLNRTCKASYRLTNGFDNIQ